jgi:hypothetical protein
MVSGGSYVLDRLLDRPGEVLVRVGDAVAPETVIARAAAAEKPMMLFVASELGVPNDNVQRYLTRPVGSTFNAGDVIARARRGLRTVSVTAPSGGTLLGVDESNGTVTFSVSSGQDALRALVHGEVERINPDYGAVVRASGARVFGILGFGEDAVGELVFGPDRPDREVTPDAVRDLWRGKIVVCGMTVGVPALQKLKQVGVAGIIVGSLAESDIRRFLTTGASQAGTPGTEVPPRVFWGSRHSEAPFVATASDAPFVIVVTEGFGRVPMAEPMFNFLRGYENQIASIKAATSVDATLRRPEIYITGDASGAGERASDDLAAGRTVRLTGSRQLGIVATCETGSFPRHNAEGVAEQVTVVRLTGGEIRTVPVANVEVLA